MIDRSQAHVCLRPRNLLTALAISCALFSILLISWLACASAGVIAFAACWAVVVALGVVLYAIALGLAIGIIFVGFVIDEHEKENGNGGADWAVGIALILGVGVGLGGIGWATTYLAKFYPPYHQMAQTCLRDCLAFGQNFIDIFLACQVYLWAWSVLAIALLAAAIVLLFLAILKCETWFKAAFRKIHYACQKGHSRALPLFCCPTCNEAHDDLAPTVYGVWKARCGQCGTPLPASDLAGRLTLKSICRENGCGPIFTAIGMHSEFHLAVVGASNSGKTNFMIAAVRELIDSFGPSHGIEVRFANPADEHEYNRKVDDLDKARVPAATVSMDRPAAFNLVLQPRHGPGCTLYLYDVPGEDNEAGDLRMTGHTFHRHVDAILFVVDPSAEDDLQRRYPEINWSSMNPARVKAATIFGNLMQVWERMLRINSSQPIDVPVAVIISKMDAFQEFSSADMKATYADMKAAANAAREPSEQARQFLVGGGLASLVQNLEARFPHIAYFTISALGRAPETENTASFQSTGALAPLFWVCYQSGALTDASTVFRSLRHFGRYANRVFVGKEGVWAGLGLWCVVILGLTPGVLALWYVANTGALVGGLAIVGGTTLALCGRMVLPPQDRPHFRAELHEAILRFRYQFRGKHGQRILAFCGSFILLSMLIAVAWYLW